MSLSRNQVISWLKKININDKKVIDLGAGKKEQWVINNTQGLPKDYIACDIVKFEGIEYKIDLNEPLFKSTLPVGFNDKFDVVFAIEVFEHLYNPINALNYIYDILDSKGIAYISVPFINPIHDEVDYLRYTEEWFLKMATMIGFTDCFIERRKATKGKDTLIKFYKQEGMRMSRLRSKRGEGHKYSDVGYLITLIK